MLYDSTFLFHLAGDRGTKKQNDAMSFLEAHPDAPVFTSRICWMEFATGYETRAAVDRGLSDFTLLEIDEDIAWRASRIRRFLKYAGNQIGDNDIWIAATAQAYDLPVVTLNKKHFQRVPQLEVLDY